MRCFTAIALIFITACAYKPVHPFSQSWDQERLKTNDRGCPTSVFIAPHGDLVQCQLEIDSLLPQPVTYPKFDTMEQAAIEALKQIADKHGNAYEWGGVIGRASDGKYAFSTPNTDFEGDAVQIKRSLPPDIELVGGYHTHPCLPYHDVEYFSSEDLLSVIFGHQEAAFMGDFCTGSVHEFKRGDKPDVDKVPGGVWLTKGRIVGTFSAPVKAAQG